MTNRLGTSDNPLIVDSDKAYIAMLKDANKKLGSHGRMLEADLQDVVSIAGRLALELECLLMDTKDNAAVSKWWDSAHEALSQWQEYKRNGE